MKGTATPTNHLTQAKRYAVGSTHADEGRERETEAEADSVCVRERDRGILCFVTVCCLKCCVKLPNSLNRPPGKRSAKNADEASCLEIAHQDLKAKSRYGEDRYNTDFQELFLHDAM